MNCWLNIYKPKNISSAKLVSIIKKNCGKNKVGHCGTLDLEAEGVLPIAIGEATKLVRILMEARKKYIFTIQFGMQTDSGDISGNIIKTTNHLPLSQDCYNVCKNFIGIIKQIPPAFSALKVNGVRAYKLARQNAEVALKERQIEIYNLECLDFDQRNNTAKYLVECSKGTYVRTLAEDIALFLQSLGFVIELRRIQVGLFKADEAIKITEFDMLGQAEFEKLIQEKSWKIEALLDDIPVLEASDEQAKKIKYGQECFFEHHQNIDFVWVRYDNRLLAIGGLSGSRFNSSRVFNLN
jgi:tRNA pseudouridine55 synthase